MGLVLIGYLMGKLVLTVQILMPIYTLMLVFKKIQNKYV